MLNRELLDLVFRWIHVIAAIMWVGNSLLFNWLDRNLKPAARARDGSMGEIWLLHSGAFYEVEKTLDPGPVLPQPMHWFRWQAYTTWISGAILLAVVYYMSASAMLISADSPLSAGQAIAIGAGTVFGGVVVYHAIWSSPLQRFPMAGALISIALLLGVTVMLGILFTGRAAFLHVGALMGSIMASNVSTAIVPAQRAQVQAVERREPPDPRYSKAAKIRSMHNNYMTFPVIALMVSSHFPSFYSAAYPWAVLSVILVSGAAVRHILNVRFGWTLWKPALSAVIASAVVALALLTARPAPRGVTSATASFADVERIIEQRCLVCHSAAPANVAFGTAPAGVTFDTPTDIRARLDRIEARSVVSKTMPPGNLTNMTDAERAVLGGWIHANR